MIYYLPPHECLADKFWSKFLCYLNLPKFFSEGTQLALSISQVESSFSDHRFALLRNNAKKEKGIVGIVCVLDMYQ